MSPERPRFYGTEGDAHAVCDLCLRQPLKVLEAHEFRLLWRQLRHRTSHFPNVVGALDRRGKLD